MTINWSNILIVLCIYYIYIFIYTIFFWLLLFLCVCVEKTVYTNIENVSNVFHNFYLVHKKSSKREDFFGSFFLKKSSLSLLEEYGNGFLLCTPSSILSLAHILFNPESFYFQIYRRTVGTKKKKTMHDHQHLVVQEFVRYVAACFEAYFSVCH